MELNFLGKAIYVLLVQFFVMYIFNAFFQHLHNFEVQFSNKILIKISVLEEIGGNDNP